MKEENGKGKKQTKDGGIYTLDKERKKLIHLQQTARRAAIHWFTLQHEERWFIIEMHQKVCVFTT